LLIYALGNLLFLAPKTFFIGGLCVANPPTSEITLIARIALHLSYSDLTTPELPDHSYLGFAE
jgi:hypothetical protein